VSVGCAAAAICVGAGVLLGWILQLDPLKRMVPGLVAMNPLTAVSFIIAGVSLLLLRQERPARALPAIAGRAGAAIVLSIGLTKVLSLIFGWETNIDQWLFHAQLSVAQGHFPSRMAPNTAFCFVMSGAALLFLDVETKRGNRLAEFLAVVCSLSALLAILGYVYSVSGFYKVGGFIPMALHTAITFIILCAGILLARVDKGILAIIGSDTAGGFMARRLLPVAVVLPIALGALRLLGEKERFYDTAFGVALHSTGIILVFFGTIWWTARLLFRLDMQRKHSDAVRGEHEERFRQLAENIEDIFWISCANKKEMLYISPGYEKIWGRPAEGVYQNPLDWCAALHPDDRERVTKAFVENGALGTSREEYRIIQPDGRERWIRDRSFPVRDSAGNIYRVAGIASDITEQKAAQEIVQSARRDAERANMAKSEFLSRMSHELRTPLNAILGFGQLLEADELTDEQQESVGFILSAGKHLLNLINEVLDISRIEAGGMAVSVEPVSVCEVVEEAITLVRPLAAKSGVKVRNQLCDIPSTFVMADRQRLKQVFLNLLSNAIKYNRQHGEVRIEAPSISDGRVDAAGSVSIAITDTGIGMRPDRVERLFTPFDRLGAETTNVEGTGLGLALSKRLVELMGATIEVRSEPGIGSTFTLDFIRAASPEAILQNENVDCEFMAVGESAAERVILYVEDNLSNLRLVERVLLTRRGSIKLMVAMQGRMGIDLAREHRPDLILLDLHLPDITGYELLEQLAGDERTRSIPVIVLTADATAAQLTRVKNAGARDYLTKPLNVKQFVEAVESAFHESTRA
jgi:PAS domain S-box-containing protein